METMRNQQTASAIRSCTVIACLFGLWLTTCPALADGVSFETGDFNSDGLLDVAVARLNVGRIDVYPATGTDTFGAPDAYAVPAPWDLAVLDIEGDSDSDIAAACASPHSVIILGNDGSGNFSVYQNISLDYQPSVIVPAEGQAVGGDLIVFDIFQAARTLRVNNGYGYFIPSDLPVTDPPSVPGTDASIAKCGNELSCSSSPSDSGIQACMEAAHCRADKCTWAACVLYNSGEIGFLGYAAAMMSCHLVHDTEVLACIPANVIPR